MDAPEAFLPFLSLSLTHRGTKMQTQITPAWMHVHAYLSLFPLPSSPPPLLHGSVTHIPKELIAMMGSTSKPTILQDASTKTHGAETGGLFVSAPK